MIRRALLTESAVPVPSSGSLSKRPLGSSTGDGTGRPRGDKLEIKLIFVCFEAIIHRRTEKVNLMGKKTRVSPRRDPAARGWLFLNYTFWQHCRIVARIAFSARLNDLS